MDLEVLENKIEQDRERIDKTEVKEMQKLKSLVKKYEGIIS